MTKIAQCKYCGQEVEVIPTKEGRLWINPSHIADQVPHYLTCKKWPKSKGQCKYCGQKITWIKTEAGKWLPMEGSLPHKYFCNRILHTIKQKHPKKKQEKSKIQHRSLEEFQ